MHSQQNAVSDSNTTIELRALAKADQDDRKSWLTMTENERKALDAMDMFRRNRVAALLQKNLLKTGEDFNNAALIFQHGLTPEDFETAHELYFIAQCKGQSSNGVAISEDRWLRSLGRPQRFGGQFSPKGTEMQPVDELKPGAVSDELRLDFMMPPLKLAKEKGVNAIMDAIEDIQKRMAMRMNAQWLEEHGASAESKELERLSQQKTLEAKAIETVLEYYRSDRIFTPKDFVHASQCLSKSYDPQLLLLAHEFAILAAIRGDNDGKKLFTFTIDRFLINIDKPERYGTVHGKRAYSLTNGVIEALDL